MSGPDRDEEHQHRGEHPLALRGRAGRALFVLGPVVYAVVLIVVARRWEFPEVTATVAAVLLLALGTELAAKALIGLLFRETLSRHDRSISLRGAVVAAVIGTATARLLPAGTAIAPTAMAWAVRDEEPRAAGAALRTAMIGYGGLLTVTGVAIALGSLRFEASAALAGAAAPGLAVAGLGASMLVGSRWLSRLVALLPRRLRRHFAPTASGDRVTGTELGLILARILTEATTLWLVLRVLGIDVGPDQALIVFGLGTAIAGLPLTPGGLGVVEGGMVGALAGMGFGAEAVVAPVLVYRIVNYWIPAGLGIAAASRSVAQAPIQSVDEEGYGTDTHPRRSDGRSGSG